MKQHLLLVLANFLISFAVLAENSTTNNTNSYQAGIDYKIINPAWSDESEKTVIYEFFSYMCPGCHSFEPQMEKLQDRLSEQQEIIRIPVAFYKQWEPHAKTYHALQIMGELSRVHKALFTAIHQYKKPLRTLDDIADWLAASFSIDKQSFLATAQSFAVDSRLRKGKQMAKAMGVARVPTLVVDGRYRPDFNQLKTADHILDATLYLADKSK
jgi:thiol:disulfide interchange protein DsbA